MNLAVRLSPFRWRGPDTCVGVVPATGGALTRASAGGIRGGAAILAGSLVLLCTVAAFAETEPVAAPDPSPGYKRVDSEAGRAYVIYVDGKPGTDITANIQKAVDMARANYGGTVMLPPGSYTVSKTISLAGSIERFPKGGPSGIVLSGL